MHVTRHPVLVLALALAAACSGRDKSSAQAVGDTVGAAHRAAILTPSTIPYSVTAIPAAGRITGSVAFDGAPPGDTAFVVPADQNGCGKPLVVQLLSRSNGKVANAVVWITDVRQGKALPAERRFQLTNDNCAWDPQVQAAVAGGALNVVNYDPLAERAFATDVSTGDTVAMAPFTDDGQVIPYDRLLRTPRVLEFSVESRPMSRAWVVVLDQPYFAVTDSHGAFTIDGVPPGVHHVRAWHAMLGVADGTVTVAANGTATVELRFGTGH
jgi:polysaccharide lyase family 4-like protein